MKSVQDVSASALKALRDNGLGHLRGRVFDSSFSVLLREPEEIGLVIMGLNGSLADSDHTNETSIQRDAENMHESNLDRGLEGGWGGVTKLAKAINKIPTALGFDKSATIYTNAYLTCSQGADDLRKSCKKLCGYDLSNLELRCANFFRDFTLKQSRPRLILAYSNNMNALSATRFLHDNFGKPKLSERLVSKNTRYRYFNIQFEQRRIPVIGINHQSYPPSFDSETVKNIFESFPDQTTALQTGFV